MSKDEKLVEVKVGDKTIVIPLSKFQEAIDAGRIVKVDEEDSENPDFDDENK